MKSNIKLYGPPILEALHALEKLAIKTPEVCIMDSLLMLDLDKFTDVDKVGFYFTPHGGIPKDRCDHIISKTGGGLGDYDFYYEWFIHPTTAQVQMLIGKIDEALKPLGVRYTITTK